MTAPRTRLQADERRRSIVDVAFELLGTEGFEGFTTREVAARAKINSATLHHYFPTKEDLIAAVGARLAEAFATEKAPTRAQVDVPPAVAELRQEFADLSFYMRRRPLLPALYREFASRARRDASARDVLEALNRGWQEKVTGILERGRRARVFRNDIDPGATAIVIVCALWGVVSLFDLSPAAFSRTCEELEKLVLR